MLCRTAGLVLLAVVTCAPLANAQTSPGAAVARCAANQLTINTEDVDGSYYGTSHGGALLVLRNISASECALNPFASLILKDRQNEPLNVAVVPVTPFRGPIVDGRPLPMGHGPVVLPIVLAAGAEATATLRWTSGQVFDHGSCVDAAYLTARLGADITQGRIVAHICGADATHIEMTATRLALDPVYKP